MEEAKVQPIWSWVEVHSFHISCADWLLTGGDVLLATTRKENEENPMKLHFDDKIEFNKKFSFSRLSALCWKQKRNEKINSKIVSHCVVLGCSRVSGFCLSDWKSRAECERLKHLIRTRMNLTRSSQHTIQKKTRDFPPSCQIFWTLFKRNLWHDHDMMTIVGQQIVGGWGELWK